VACLLAALCGGALGEKRSKSAVTKETTPRYMDRYMKAKEGINAEERATREPLSIYEIAEAVYYFVASPDQVTGVTFSADDSLPIWA
jgi:hypothetical protein